MEITWLKNEDNAIQYVYASAVPQKIPLDIFKEIVQSSKENCLPEFYVISEQGKYIGYIYYWPIKKKTSLNLLHFLHVIMAILCQKKLTKKYWNLSANGVV